jgi:hypothetical protein
LAGFEESLYDTPSIEISIRWGNLRVSVYDIPSLGYLNRWGRYKNSKTQAACGFKKCFHAVRSNPAASGISRLRDPAFIILCCGVGPLSLDLKFKEQGGVGSTHVLNEE